MHKSGFVNIIGKPNVGKSTLLNALIGEKLSIITNKPQTTRHRILAIINEDDYQIVFSDTPGMIDDPHYKMQDAMNKFAYSAFEDADVLIYMADVTETPAAEEALLQRLSKSEMPKILILNKIDISNQEQVAQVTEWWSERVEFDHICALSAMEKVGVESLLSLIVSLLSEGPAFYPKDQFTDRSQRFFVSEIIREKILERYHQEIPYSCEVNVNEFKEGTAKGAPIVRIMADIIVNRKTQKSIIIGKQGSAIKALGMAARKSIEEFLESRVHLELYVKVKEKWRDDDNTLKSYGYLQ